MRYFADLRRPAAPRQVLAAALISAVAGSAHGANLDYRLGVAALASNNVGLARTDTRDDTVLSPTLRFELAQTSSALMLTARGEIQYLDYLDNTFDDETRSELAGQMQWVIAPQRLHWVMEDYLSSQPTDVLNSFNPGNQQQVNVFNAGPRWFARLGEVTRAQAELRYSNTWAEKTKEFNGDRYNLAARVLHDFDPTSYAGFNAEVTRVGFDRPLAVDYDRYDAFASYSARRTHVDVDIDLGYTRLDRDRDGSNNSAPLLRATLAWRLGGRHVVSSQFDHEFADAARDVASRAGLTDGPIIDTLTSAELLANADVFRNTRIAASYRYTGERLSAQISPYVQRINYAAASTPDQTSLGGFVSGDLRLRPRLSLGAQVSYERRRFDSLPARRDRDLLMRLSLTQVLTRHWSAQAGLQRRERDSSDALQSYNENLVSISVTYTR